MQLINMLRPASQELLNEALANPDNLVLFEESGGWGNVMLCESVGGKMVFRGKFQEADRVNKNRRIYPEAVLRKNVDALNEFMREGSVWGELDHPQDSVVHLKDTSHRVTRLWWENNVLMGEAEVLDTAHGRQLKALLNSGGRIGISSRGVGNGAVNSEGVLVIGESFKLITFDVVADPSCHLAFQKVVVPGRRTNEGVANNSRDAAAKTEASRVDTAVVNPDAVAAVIRLLAEDRAAYHTKNRLR